MLKALLGPLVLIIGVATGFTASELTRPEPKSDSATDQTAPNAPMRDAPSASTADQPPTSKPGVAPTEATPRIDPADELAVALATIPRKPREMSGDRITGTVLTRDGRPVEGVRIEAVATGEPTGRKRVDTYTASPVEYAAQAVDRHRFLNESGGVTETDSDGRYAFEGLARATYTINAEKAGFQLQARGRRWIEPGARLDFFADESRSFEVVIRRPDGNAPEEATLHFQPSGTSVKWSSEDRTVEVAAGSYDVHATVGNEFKSESQRVDLTDLDPPRAIFDLVPRNVITGKIIATEGAVVTNYKVRWMQIPPGSEPNLEVLDTAGETMHWAGERGYTLTDLASGTYVLGAQLVEGRIEGHAVVSLSSGTVEQDITVDPIAREDVIVVWVYDEHGKPLPSANVQLVHRSINRRGSLSSTRIPQPDGSIWLLPGSEFWELRRDPGTTLLVEAESDAYGSRKVELIGTEVRIDLSRPAFVTVMLGNYTGSVAEGRTTVSLRSPLDSSIGFGGGGGESSQSIDDRGQVRFGPVGVGPYTVSVEIKQAESDWRGTEVESIETDLAPGENSLAISIPPLRRVVVRFPELDSAAQVSVSPVEGGGVGGGRQQASAEEPFVLEAIPDGAYLLTAFGAELTMMKLVVNGDAELDYVPTDIDALLVRAPRGSALADLGFEDGDLIIALNGVQFENGQQLMMAFMAAMSRDKLKMTVDRGGREMELEVGGEAMQRAGGNGGVLPANRSLRNP